MASTKIGALVIQRDIVHSVLEPLPVEDIRKIGALSAQRHKDSAITLMGTKQKLDSVLYLLDITYGKNARWFKFTHIVNGSDNRILLNHDLGIKWSCFLDGYMRSFFMKMLDIPVTSIYLEGSVVLEFRA